MVVVVGYMGGRPYNNYCTLFSEVLQPEAIFFASKCITSVCDHAQPGSAGGGRGYSAPNIS